MGKVVVLQLEADSEQTVRVTLTIQEVGKPATVSVLGSLKETKLLAESLEKWQTAYRQLGGINRSITPHKITYAGSIQKRQSSCNQLAIQLSSKFNQWLQTVPFFPIIEAWHKNLSQDEPIQVLIQTHNTLLRQLPWSQWRILEDYPLAEIALSAPNYKPPHQSPDWDRHSKSGPKILAIIGNSTGINLDEDQQMLKRLTQVQPTYLNEPQRKVLNDQLWQQSWDILFFAGHSQSDGEQGRIYFNASDSLTLPELREGLKQAQLKLAIFNSCDGLGLLPELEQLHIPTVIVMREPVPDQVAHEFLKYFLMGFTQGKSLHQSIQEARRRLQGLEDQFPCASWLPIICQNPAVPPVTWASLQTGQRHQRQRQLLPSALLISVGVALGVIGFGSMGWLQPFELPIYDLMLRSRPSEPPDPRLLLVKVTPTDLQALDQSQQRRLNFLPEPVLTQLLNRLEQDLKPRIIGLDIAQRATARSPQLKQWVKNSKLIAGCGETSQGELIAPPPEMSLDNFQVGFVTFWLDPDNTLRRMAYEVSPGPATGEQVVCQVRHSFGLLAALGYLQAVDSQKYAVTRTETDDLQVGDVVLKTITRDTGGYQFTNDGGWEMLLNYRAGGQVAEIVSLSQVLTAKLSDQQRANWQGRIILVGAESETDYHPTPYNRKMPGVEVHAHQVSQILSTILDDRPLISGWSAFAESLWIGAWAILGGLLIWVSQHSKINAAMLCLALVSLEGLAVLLLWQGIWVPVAAPLLAILGSSGGMLLYRRRLRSQLR